MDAERPGRHSHGDRENEPVRTPDPKFRGQRQDSFGRQFGPSRGPKRIVANQPNAEFFHVASKAQVHAARSLDQVLTQQ